MTLTLLEAACDLALRGKCDDVTGWLGLLPLIAFQLT